MKKVSIFLLVLAVIVVAYFVGARGGIRSAFKASVEKVTASGNWTPERRLKDPVGYSQFVEARLRADVATYDKLRADLDKSSYDLSRQIDEKEKTLASKAALLDAFLGALDKGKFPVEIYGSTYDESQLKTQIYSINQELEFGRKGVDEFKKAREQANAEVGRLIKTIDEYNNQLATIETNRNVFLSKQKTAETSRLVDDMSEAFEGAVAFSESGLRSIDEILASQKSENVDSQTSGSFNSAIDQLLAEYREREQTKVD